MLVYSTELGRCCFFVPQQYSTIRFPTRSPPRCAREAVSSLTLLQWADYIAVR